MPIKMYRVALLVALFIIAKFAWCDEVSDHTQLIQERLDPIDHDTKISTLLLKDLRGKTLAVIQKGNIDLDL